MKTNQCKACGGRCRHCDGVVSASSGRGRPRFYCCVKCRTATANAKRPKTPIFYKDQVRQLKYLLRAAEGECGGPKGNQAPLEYIYSVSCSNCDRSERLNSAYETFCWYLEHRRHRTFSRWTPIGLGSSVEALTLQQREVIRALLFHAEQEAYHRRYTFMLRCGGCFMGLEFDLPEYLEATSVAESLDFAINHDLPNLSHVDKVLDRFEEKRNERARMPSEHERRRQAA